MSRTKFGVDGDYMALLEEFTSELFKLYGERLRSVCLFGSVARGEAVEGSDVDVLVVVENLPRGIGMRYRKANQVRMKLKKCESYRRLREAGKPCTISEIYLTPEELRGHPPILLDIVEDGIIIYDKGNILKETLNKLRERLKALGAKRVRGKKGRYWILKPDIKIGEEVRI